MMANCIRVISDPTSSKAMQAQRQQDGVNAQMLRDLPLVS